MQSTSKRQNELIISYQRPYPDKELNIKLLEKFTPNTNPVIIPVFSDMSEETTNKIIHLLNDLNIKNSLAKRGNFSGNAGDLSYFPAENKLFSSFLLIGLGKREKINQNLILNHFAQAFEKVNQLKWNQSLLLLNEELKEISAWEFLLERLANLAELSRFHSRYLLSSESEKSQRERKYMQTLSIYILDKLNKFDFKQFSKEIRSGIITGRSMNRARELVSLPGNQLYPTLLADRARQMAADNKLEYRELTISQLKKKGMLGIVSVGKGSENEPRLIQLSYKGNNKKNSDDLILVGKGITFDTGGISLKPASDMHEMKTDMGGAAAVLFALEAIARAELKINVSSIVAAAENMPDGQAQKPGDVYTSYKGLTVEVLNTDAEGRLVLADALAYASEQKPGYIVDLATLTGASIIALGNHLAALFSNNETFREELFQSGEKSLDRIWPMPLYDEYSQDLKSEIADFANIGPRAGGAITAAAFLKQFVDEKIPWAHVDIASRASIKKDSGMHRKGTTGFGVRLLYFLARDMAK